MMLAKRIDVTAHSWMRRLEQRESSALINNRKVESDSKEQVQGRKEERGR
jgi:hypothetical protein